MASYSARAQRRGLKLSPIEFAQRWLGARLKRNGRPMISALCPDCGRGELEPHLDDLDAVWVLCPRCQWQVPLAALEHEGGFEPPAEGV